MQVFRIFELPAIVAANLQRLQVEPPVYSQILRVEPLVTMKNLQGETIRLLSSTRCNRIEQMEYEYSIPEPAPNRSNTRCNPVPVFVPERALRRTPQPSPNALPAAWCLDTLVSIGTRQARSYAVGLSHWPNISCPMPLWCLF